MKDIAIYGAGGFGREVACTLMRQNQKHPRWNLIGFFDDNKPIGSHNEYGIILGGINELNAWDKPLAVVIAIGNSRVLKIVYEKITNNNVTYPNIVFSTKFADENNYKLGKGNIIQGGCFLSCNVSLGDFNVLNGSVCLGHDTTMGSFNTIMPGVRISGEVHIGDNNFIGVGAIVLQGLNIGNKVKLSAGSVLVHKPKDDSLYIGNPAKLFKY